MARCASSENVARWCLLHDAPETWLADLPTPVKHSARMAPFRRLESKVMLAVAERFDLSWPEPREVKLLDLRARKREVEEWLPAALPATTRHKPLDASFIPAWPSPRARCEFLAEAKRLGLD
jgi:hypothetical protein